MKNRDENLNQLSPLPRTLILPKNLSASCLPHVLSLKYCYIVSKCSTYALRGGKTGLKSLDLVGSFVSWGWTSATWETWFIVGYQDPLFLEHVINIVAPSSPAHFQGSSKIPGDPLNTSPVVHALLLPPVPLHPLLSWSNITLTLCTLYGFLVNLLNSRSPHTSLFIKKVNWSLL